MMINKDETLRRMKAEILEDIASRRVPESIDAFEDLHSFVDANEYGGFCEDETYEAVLDQLGESFFTECQEAIHEWLATGRPA